MKGVGNLNGRILFARLGFCGGRSTATTTHMTICPTAVGVLRMTNEGVRCCDEGTRKCWSKNDGDLRRCS